MRRTEGSKLRVTAVVPNRILGTRDDRGPGELPVGLGRQGHDRKRGRVGGRLGRTGRGVPRLESLQRRPELRRGGYLEQPTVGVASGRALHLAERTPASCGRRLQRAVVRLWAMGVSRRPISRLGSSIAYTREEWVEAGREGPAPNPHTPSRLCGSLRRRRPLPQAVAQDATGRRSGRPQG